MYFRKIYDWWIDNGRRIPTYSYYPSTILCRSRLLRSDLGAIPSQNQKDPLSWYPEIDVVGRSHSRLFLQTLKTFGKRSGTAAWNEPTYTSAGLIQAGKAYLHVPHKTGWTQVHGHHLGICFWPFTLGGEVRLLHSVQGWISLWIHLGYEWMSPLGPWGLIVKST